MTGPGRVATSEQCRSCGAPVFWARMVGSGKWNPLNVEPSPVGSVRLTDDGRGEIVPAHRLDDARSAGVVLYLSHFATCPNAGEWRR